MTSQKGRGLPQGRINTFLIRPWIGSAFPAFIFILIIQFSLYEALYFGNPYQILESR